jgi:HAD superfamily hydrolase (TIGR01490 family)
LSFAFFDLDGTLLSDPSLPSFYQFYLMMERPELGAERWRRVMKQVADMRERGVPRERLNEWFYNNHFVGMEVSRAQDYAVQWLSSQVQNTRFFNERIVRYVNQHRADGVEVVLITGSFRELVEPLAAMVDARSYICTPLEERNGFYTGALTSEPMIGKGKSVAVERFLERQGCGPELCYGYADDHSDIPFLERLGYPRVLASGTEELLAHADKRGWTVIAA